MVDPAGKDWPPRSTFAGVPLIALWPLPRSADGARSPGDDPGRAESPWARRRCGRQAAKARRLGATATAQEDKGNQPGRVREEEEAAPERGHARNVDRGLESVCGAGRRCCMVAAHRCTHGAHDLPSPRVRTFRACPLGAASPLLDAALLICLCLFAGGGSGAGAAALSLLAGPQRRQPGGLPAGRVVTRPTSLPSSGRARPQRDEGSGRVLLGTSCPARIGHREVEVRLGLLDARSRRGGR